MGRKVPKVSNSEKSTAEYVVWGRVGYSDLFGFKVKLNFFHSILLREAQF